MKSLQQPDGSVAGDEWGEIDTRCTTCHAPMASLLQGILRRDGHCHKDRP